MSFVGRAKHVKIKAKSNCIKSLKRMSFAAIFRYHILTNPKWMHLFNKIKYNFHNELFAHRNSCLFSANNTTRIWFSKLYQKFNRLVIKNKVFFVHSMKYWVNFMQHNVYHWETQSTTLSTNISNFCTTELLFYLLFWIFCLEPKKTTFCAKKKVLFVQKVNVFFMS